MTGIHWFEHKIYSDNTFRFNLPTMDFDFFWDHISAERAESLLTGSGSSGPGSYLLRCGRNDTILYISFIDLGGKIKHWMLPVRRDHHLFRARPELVGDPRGTFLHVREILGTMWTYPVIRTEQPDWVEEENTDSSADCRVCGLMNVSK